MKARLETRIAELEGKCSSQADQVERLDNETRSLREDLNQQRIVSRCSLAARLSCCQQDAQTALQRSQRETEQARIQTASWQTKCEERDRQLRELQTAAEQVCACPCVIPVITLIVEQGQFGIDDC